MGEKTVPAREEHPIMSVILMFIGIAIMGGSLRYGFGSFENPGAGFLPFFTGLFITVFSAAIFLLTLKRRWHPLRELWEGTRWPRAMMVTVCLIVYSAFLNDLGFLLSTILLMGFLLRLLERISWKVTLLATFLTTLGFYLVFQIWLEAQLPRGWLGF
jgi:putative tricarboxylic transport membrane protein